MYVLIDEVFMQQKIPLKCAMFQYYGHNRILEKIHTNYNLNLFWQTEKYVLVRICKFIVLS